MINKLKIKKEEIKKGEIKSFLVGSKKIIISNIENKFYALEDLCSHDDGELVSSSACIVNECEVECPRHGARFNLRTGQATRMPAIAKIQSYEVSDLNDEIEVLVGE